MPPAAREAPDVNGHHRRGHHPGRHHVETGPGPISPGGSGRSDRLRHTVSVSRARPLRNSPLRQSGSRNGWLLQPGPPAGAFLHPNPGMLPTGCPQATIPGGLPPHTTPVPGPLKHVPASGQQRPARTAGAPTNSPDSPTRCSPPASRKRTPRQERRRQAPGQGPPEAHPPEKTLLLKRGKQPPSYSENTISEEGEQTGDPAEAVDLRPSENESWAASGSGTTPPTAAGAETW